MLIGYTNDLAVIITKHILEEGEDVANRTIVDVLKRLQEKRLKMRQGRQKAYFL